MRKQLLLFIIVVFSISFSVKAQVPGEITTPATPATNPMDPNGDGFITISHAAFIGFPPTFEESEFELNFQRIPEFEEEPDSDIQTGANCQSTDILASSITHTSHSWLLISDGDPGSGDEFIIFRARLGKNPSGAFGYSFLFDTDSKFGFVGANADPSHTRQSRF